MVIARRKATLFGAAAAVRLLLFLAFPSLPNLLAGRVEVSTPVTSFKKRKYLGDRAFEAIADNLTSSTGGTVPLHS